MSRLTQLHILDLDSRWTPVFSVTSKVHYTGTRFRYLENEKIYVTARILALIPR
jgi:hypothetical protein